MALFRLPSQGPNRSADGMRNAERLWYRRLVEKSQPAGCRDHGALRKFLGIAGLRCRL